MSHSSFWSIQTHKSLVSTQDTLKALIDKGEAEEGTLIHAIEQTGGYGRHGRKWECGSGNLSFSFMLSPRANRLQSTSLSLVTGIALVRAIQDALGITNDDVILKWPNDVMIKGKKCAGILLETMKQNVIIGTGVNISSSPIEEAVSLSDYNKNITLTPEALLSRFLEVFEDIYPLWQEQGFVVFKPEFMKLSYKKGTPVHVKLPDNTVEGLFQDVDEQGNMLILCKDTQKLQKITAGDVFLV